MSRSAHGVAVPCAACGAALPVDLRSRRLRCEFCGRRQVLPAAQLAAVREHLARLAAIGRAAEEAASEGDYQQRRRRRDLGAVLAFFAPLLAGWWIILGLGVGVSCMFAAFALWPSIEDHQALASLVALGGMGVWAAWVGALRLILTRRRAVIAELPAWAAPARCERCGATLPVPVGTVMRCPFCTADLVPDALARDAVEATAEGRAAELRARAAIEAATTEKSRGPALEAMIDMLSAGQLFAIGMGVVIAVITIVIALVL